MRKIIKALIVGQILLFRLGCFALYNRDFEVGLSLTIVNGCDITNLLEDDFEKIVELILAQLEN